jgi:fibronectin-binding autotransporter adhesin
MKMKPAILALAAASIGSAFGQSFTSTSATGLWNTSRWNNSTDAAPYTSAWVANSNASFTSGTYNFSGANSSGSVSVGNITLASGVTVNFTAASGTLATSATRTIDVGSGALLDFNTQAMSTAVGTGFIKSGAGVLATSGGAYSGGFTLNAGTVIARGVDAMGANASNVLTLNGGVVASNATRSFANTKFGGGIVIGGNVQFGELAANVSLASNSANLSFANNVSLGSAVRTLTLGNDGTQTFSGIISNTSGGLTFAANSGAGGRFDITNTGNTFTGPININGGEVRFTADGSIGNAANDIVIDGGRFAKASDALTVTLGAGRDISVGDAVGTSISSPGTGVLIYNNAIANKTGETGSWAKQGGGTLELGGVSTYTGDTAINNGFVKLTTGNDRLPTGTVVSIGQAASANLGTLDLNARNQQIAGLNSTAGTSASALVNNTVTSATAATLTIGGAGTYSYGDGTDANSGIITGAISLVKQGNGTQTLGDTNTYSGTTSVNGGTLIVNGNQTAANGAVSVATGTMANATVAKLGGNGTIGGSVTLAAESAAEFRNGGVLAPTAAASGTKLTVAGTTTFGEGSLFEWNMSATAPASDPGVVANSGSYGQLSATGAIGGSNAVFNIVLGASNAFSDAFWNSNKSWTNIFTGAGAPANLTTIFSSIRGTDLTWDSVNNWAYNGTITPGGDGGYFTASGNSLTWTAVPEPSSALAGLLIAAGLLRRRRVA